MGERGHPLSADFKVQDRDTEGTSSTNEALPPLLRLISTGHYSFIARDSPDASSPSGVKLSDLESGNIAAGPDDKHPRFAGVDAGLQSGVIIPEVGIGNLYIDDKGPTYHPQQLTGGLKSPSRNTSDKASAVLGKAHVTEGQNTSEDGILTPRSILSKPRSPGVSSSPRADGIEMQKKVSFGKKSPKGDTSDVTQEVLQTPLRETGRQRRMRKFFSQQLHTNTNHGGQHRLSSFPRCKSESSNSVTGKENYVIFKTKSSKFERPISRLLSKHQGEEKEPSEAPCRKESSTSNIIPAGRYFDALKGPELEILKDSEELLLPPDQKWPFLLRFPIGCFGITLGLGSQTILWKTLATSSSMSFLHIPLAINFILWCLSMVALAQY